MQLEGRIMLIRLGRIITSCFLLGLLLFIPLVTPIVEASNLPIRVGEGPYVDRVEYNHIIGSDDQAYALLNNEIDIAESSLDNEAYELLESANNIEITRTLSYNYGYFIINTAKYPFNITAFRRAIAIAMDKQHISEDIMNGLSIPHDSSIPKGNPLSVESILGDNYYLGDSDTANSILDNAGFLINSTTSFRHAPNGSAFDFVVHADYNYDAIQEYMVEVLRDLHLDVRNHDCVCWHCCVLTKIQTHGNWIRASIYNKKWCLNPGNLVIEAITSIPFRMM